MGRQRGRLTTEKGIWGKSCQVQGKSRRPVFTVGTLEMGGCAPRSRKKGSLWRSPFSANWGTARLEAENRPVMSVEAGSETPPRVPAAGFTLSHNRLLLGLGWACSLPPKEENVQKRADASEISESWMVTSTCPPSLSQSPQ